jgi:SAM-dependent methyltransferase
VRPASAFDELAEDYDASFTHTFLGTVLREAVWRRLDTVLDAGDRVLELGCGTGEDAVHLAERGARVLATDASEPMVEAARRKAEASGLGDRISVRQLNIEEVGSPGVSGDDPWRGDLWSDDPGSDHPGHDQAEGDDLLFDGALSNFGGLNCVADLGETARGLATRLKPDAWAVLCLMGPLVPWEWGWFLARGEPRKAFRRINEKGAAWRDLTVRYPSIGTVRRAFAPAFRFRRASALGALLPPTYAHEWAARHQRLIRFLNRVERRVETWPPVVWLGDHYVIELERK